MKIVPGRTPHNSPARVASLTKMLDNVRFRIVYESPYSATLFPPPLFEKERAKIMRFNGHRTIDKDTPQRISCCGVFFMAVWQGWEPKPARHSSFFSRAFSFLADFCAGLKKCFHFIEYCDIMQRTNKMPHKKEAKS